MFLRRTTPLIILLLLASFPAGQGDIKMSTETGEMTYQIQTTWDDQPVDHDPVTITLAGRGSEGVEIKVDAPFFGVPGNPGGEPGKPFDHLWDYEVVEVFFADGDEGNPKYLEVELSPWGQHLVLLLEGVKNIIHSELPITYTAKITGNRWTGSALIPASYFPPEVTRFNAFAIHDKEGVEGDPKRYEALFPVPNGKYQEANFHRLEYFRPLNFELLQSGNKKAVLSETWSAYTANKCSPVKVATQTLGGDTAVSNASLTLIDVVDGEDAWLNVSLSAAFLGNGSNVPIGAVEEPLSNIDLDTYETLRAYIANDEGKVLVLIFSPYGQYDAYLYSAPYNMISRGHRMAVTTTLAVDKWMVEALVPLALLPANVQHATVASVYMMNNETHYETCYTLDNRGIALPDLFVLGRYKNCGLLFPHGINDAYSDLWNVEN